MKSHTIILGTGCGKTAMMLRYSALLDQIDNSIDVRRVFISHKFDELLDGEQRLLAILDGLDQDANAADWDIFLLGDPDQIVPGNVSRIKNPHGTVAISRAQFRSMVRSLLHRANNLVRLVLSFAEKPDHPVNDFLLERRWFFLHTSHPPRPFRQTPVCRWRVCSRLAFLN